MRGDNTILYLVVGIVLMHFLLGFGWLVYKLTKRNPEKNKSKQKE